MTYCEVSPSSGCWWGGEWTCSLAISPASEAVSLEGFLSSVWVQSPVRISSSSGDTVIHLRPMVRYFLCQPPQEVLFPGS